MPLTLLRLLAVHIVLSASARRVRDASLHFVTVSLQRSSPVTAAGPPRIRTVFRFVEPKGAAIFAEMAGLGQQAGIFCFRHLDIYLFIDLQGFSP